MPITRNQRKGSLLRNKDSNLENSAVKSQQKMDQFVVVADKDTTQLKVVKSLQG